MSLVGEIDDSHPTLSNIISKLEPLKKKMELMEKEWESLKQEQQVLNNQIQIIMEHLLQSNSMREGQVEGEKRNMRLQFKSNLPPEIETGIDIKATGLNSIQVELVDESGQLVNSGPEASANVELGALCHRDECPHVKENNKPRLVGELQFKLNEGIGTVGKIKFKHGKDWLKQSDFILVARVVDEFTRVEIKEAKTGPFKIKDFRNGYYNKRETLTLEDDIYRLKNISRKGKIWPRLQKQHIYTMKDFLHWLFKDPAELKRIIGFPLKKFEETIKYAQNGMINDRLCCYSDLDGKMMVVFDFVNQVLGVVLWEQYYHFQGLSNETKENAQKLVKCALQNWKDVEFFDNEASLLQKFPQALTCSGLMFSSVEGSSMQTRDISSKLTECNMTLFNNSSGSLLNNSTSTNPADVLYFQQLKSLSTEIFSDDTDFLPENLSTCIINARMEEYGREIMEEQDPMSEFHANNKQHSTSNMAPVKCSRPWIFMITIVTWRAMLKKNTSRKRGSPLPEASTGAKKKQRMCYPIR